MVDGEPANPSREALVEPQLAPPIHGDQIAEPLMCQLVSDNVCDTVAIAVCRCFRVKKDGSCADLFSANIQNHVKPYLPVGDETPILHRTV